MAPKKPKRKTDLIDKYAAEQHQQTKPTHGKTWEMVCDLPRFFRKSGRGSDTDTETETEWKSRRVDQSSVLVKR